MNKRQKLYPQLIYRINALLSDIKGEIRIKNFIAPTVFNSYSRTFQWPIVVDVNQWKPENIEIKKVNKFINEYKKKESELWESFKNNYKSGNEFVLNSVKDAFETIASNSTSHDEIHHALLMLHQFYPVNPEKYIDGIIHRNLIRRAKKNKGKKHEIVYAIAELQAKRKENETTNRTYVLYPWVKIQFFNSKDDTNPEKKISCQENNISLGYPPGKPDLNLEDKIPYINEKNLMVTTTTKEKKHISRNYLVPYFHGYPNFNFDYFYVIESETLLKFKNILIIPFYDKVIDGYTCGNFRGTLQVPFKNKNTLKNFVSSQLEKFLSVTHRLVQNINQSAFYEILQQKIKDSDDLLEHFIRYLPMVQDWDRIMLWKKNGVHPEYCYTRNEEGGWQKFLGNNLKQELPEGMLQKFNFTEVHLLADSNGTHNRMQILPIRRLLDKSYIPDIYAKDSASYHDHYLIFEYPNYTIFPSNEESEGKLWLKYKQEQIELLRQLALQRKIYVETSRHGSRAAATGIMARNLSHNIGSHVISYWASTKLYNTSRNLNNFFQNKNPSQHMMHIYNARRITDDSKSLFQYLQHRMDFLAEITTSFPAVELSLDFEDEILTPLLGTQNNRFDILGVSALLEYIAHSEGLDLRDKFKWECCTKFCRVSLPNGAIGAQAIYSILENFIRNAVKHYSGIGSPNNDKYFLIQLKDPREPKWSKKYFEVTIWDLRNNSCNHKIVNKLLEYIDPASKKGSLILEQTGELNQHGWGFKEMRICANFLRKRSPDELIDLLGENEPPLISLSCNEKRYWKKDSSETIVCSNGICVTNDGGKHNNLGLCFYLLKPKDMAILGNYEIQTWGNCFVIETVNLDKVIPHRLLAVQYNTDKEGIYNICSIKSNPEAPCRIISYKDENNFDDQFYLEKYAQFIRSEFKIEDFPELIFSGGGEHNNYMRLFDFNGLNKNSYGTAIKEGSDFNCLLNNNNGKKFAVFYHHLAEEAQRTGIINNLKNNSSVVYFQPLSAKHSITLRTQNPPDNLLLKEQFLLEIVESILTKVIIVDERAAELAENKFTDTLKFKDIFQSMNITVVPLTLADITYNDLKEKISNNYSENNSKPEEPSFFVIHQGILDKMEKENEGNSNKFMNNINCRWKVVDSGRGMPKELNARFIQISVLIKMLESFDKHGLSQMLYASRKPKSYRNIGG